MSTKYKIDDEIPSEVICQRLRELSKAITDGKVAISREFTMRIPAECDRDADIVLSKAATLIEQLRAELEEACGLLGEGGDNTLKGRVESMLSELEEAREEIKDLKEQVRKLEPTEEEVF